MPKRVKQTVAAEIFIANLRRLVPIGRQAPISRKIGMHPHSISRWLNRLVVVNPTLETIHKLAGALDVDMRELLRPPK